VTGTVEDQILIVCFAALMGVWMWVKTRDE